MKFKLILSILIFANFLYSQSGTTDCNGNGDFENNAILTSDWILKRGSMYFGTPDLPQYHDNSIISDPWNVLNLTNISVSPSFFEIHDNSIPDPILSFLSKVHMGSYSLKLGDNFHNQETPSISKKFKVTSNNQNLSFWFSVVVEDNNHGNANGGFGYRIYKNNIVQEGKFYIGRNNSPLYSSAFVSGKNIKYTGWRCKSLNLSQYIGDSITVEFYTKDCAWPSGNHLGYAYIDDISCNTISNCDEDEYIGDLRDSSSCSELCFKYSLPKLNSIIGSVKFDLIKIVNGVETIVYSSSNISGTNTNLNSYCFKNIQNLYNVNIIVKATFTINGTNWIGYSNSILLSNCKLLCCNEDTVYTSTKYSYNKTLPVIVANNAQHQEIEFSSLEESIWTSNKYDQGYSGMFPLFSSQVTIDEAHTGVTSLQVSSQLDVDFTTKMCIGEPITSLPNVSYNNFKYQFSLIEDKIYKLNFWIKTLSILNTVNPQLIDIVFLNSNNNIISTTSNGVIKTNKIEGWQLFEMNFKVPIGTAAIKLRFKGGTDGNKRYFDDVKITPLQSTSKAYVYDNKSYRLLSELDENHFATFYDYDESGNLIRLRKETEKGIVTLKEMNVNFQK